MNQQNMNNFQKQQISKNIIDSNKGENVMQNIYSNHFEGEEKGGNKPTFQKVIEYVTQNEDAVRDKILAEQAKSDAKKKQSKKEIKNQNYNINIVYKNEPRRIIEQGLPIVSKNVEEYIDNYPIEEPEVYEGYAQEYQSYY